MAFWTINSGITQERRYVSKIRFLHSPGGDDLVLYLRLNVVCIARSRAGYIHGHLDTIHFLLWHLLQARRLVGEDPLMAIDLLIMGGVVFALLLVGLAYTVMEFNKMK